MLAAALVLLIAAPSFAAETQEALPQLLQQLATAEDDARRAEAARQLGSAPYRGRQALNSLARALYSDPSDEVRRQAALSALAHEGSEPIVFVSGLLRTERGDEVRRAVAAELGTAPAHLQNSEATAALSTTLLDDSSPQVRLAAAVALGLRRDRRAIAALNAALRDKSAEVAKAARAALDRIDVPKPEPTRAKRQPSQRNAVRGKDRCSGTNGWCECVNGPMKPRSRCLSLDDCEHAFQNTFRPHGYTCTWDGQQL